MKGVRDAFSRLSGAKETTVNLADGLIVVTTDPSQPVNPSHFWRELERVGFVPVKMEIWAAGRFEQHSFALEGGRWPLVNKGPAEAETRRAHFGVVEGAEDPPRVAFID